MKRLNRLLGALLLIQLVFGLILPYVFLLPLTAPPAAFLEQAAEMPPMIRLSLLMLLFGSSLPFVISLILTRIYSGFEWVTCAALLMLSLTTFVLQIIENTHWLLMLSVSELYGVSESKGGFEVTGLLVRLQFKWAHYSHILVVIGWYFALYLLFFRGRVVPRTLAVAGIIACVAHLGGIVLPAFAGVVMPYSTLFGSRLHLLRSRLRAG